MKKKLYVFLAVASICINTGYEAASAPHLEEIPTLRPMERSVRSMERRPVPSLSPIVEVSTICCGGSMSSSALCIKGTLRNFTHSAITYTTKFVAQKSGESAPFVVSGKSVTVPAQSNATNFIFIMLSGSDNTHYLPGAKIKFSS
ncbi:MAG: hypothetical protein D3923_18895, partial [Candidatus Electrothrix sp. AR3]|nr:hypothetical protein [Candidatus Electrothrix sp. AR3]